MITVEQTFNIATWALGNSCFTTTHSAAQARNNNGNHTWGCGVLEGRETGVSMACTVVDSVVGEVVPLLMLAWSLWASWDTEAGR